MIETGFHHGFVHFCAHVGMSFVIHVIAYAILNGLPRHRRVLLAALATMAIGASYKLAAFSPDSFAVSMSYNAVGTALAMFVSGVML